MQRNAFFLYSDTGQAGTRIVALGLMAMLKREVADVAYFKPSERLPNRLSQSRPRPNLISTSAKSRSILRAGNQVP